MAETPKEAEQSDIVSDAIQTEIATPESISWSSFEGKKGLTSHEFVQKVQRIAFQQGKQRDDEWVADYAATCFSGEALEWYIGLDEETQTSWRKLRAGLIQQWPVESAKTSSDVDPANMPAPAPATAPPYSPPPTSSSASLGIIKVQEGTSSLLGYVALDAAGTCIIQKEAALALVVSRPQQVHPRNPCRISIEGPEAIKDSISHMPYLGLSLLRQLGEDPDIVPSEIPYEARGNSIYAGASHPSGLCNPPRNPEGVHPLATWYISPCSKDPPGPWRKRTSLEPSVPAAAVLGWMLDPITLELTTTWVMPDDTFCDLAAYVDNTRKNPKLHMHRRRDVWVLTESESRLGNRLFDTRVALYFTPI